MTRKEILTAIGRGGALTFRDLSRANLSEADLSEANLSEANLSGANLSEANLSEANLSRANLSRADLSGANLSGANLSGANLSGANLYGADLSGADLYGAKYNNDTTFFAIQCPEEGSFTSFKKCRDGVVAKLEVLADAKRSSATSRKCRASKVKTLAVYGAKVGISQRDPSVIYRVGETIEVSNFDENRWDECSAGIHFFLTRQEAENY